MASPTFAQLMDRLKAHIKLLDDEWRAAAVTASNNFVHNQPLAETAAIGDSAADQIQLIRAARAQRSSSLASLISACGPILLDFGKLIGSPSLDVSQIARDLYDYMRGTLSGGPYRVTSRAFSRGTPTLETGSTGSGSIHTLDVDAEGLPIEDGLGYSAGDAFTVFADCVADQRNGRVRGNELFFFYVSTRTSSSGPGFRTDQLIEAPTSTIDIPSLAPEDIPSSLLQNAKFIGFNASAADLYPGWKAATSAWTGIGNDTSAGFSPIRSLSRPFTATDTFSRVTLNPTHDYMYQFIRGVNFNIPYFAAVRFNSDAGADGNVELQLGSVTHSVAVVPTTDQLLVLNDTTPKNAWPANWNTSNAEFRFRRTGATTGTVYVDSVYFVPYTYFLGRWVVILAGPASGADWTRREDLASPVGDRWWYTDTVGTTAKLQYWFSRVTNGLTLPTVGGTLITDP